MAEVSKLSESSPLEVNSNDSTEPPCIIGIGGCSSAGKITLACQLHDIFATVTKSDQKPAYSTCIVGQDRHFLPKQTCPPATFKPILPEDDKVIDHPTIVVDKDGVVHCQSTECPEAIDWARLHAALQNHAHHPDPGDVAFMKKWNAAGKTDFDMPDDHEAKQRLIAKGVDRVNAVRAAQQMENAEVSFPGRLFPGDKTGEVIAIAVVEGHVLLGKLPDAALDSAHHSQHTSNTALGNDVEARGKSTMEIVQDMLAVKLFLPLPRDVAKTRRLTRPMYQSAEPGLFWRTHGYFEEVVWARHVENHSHPFDNQQANTHGVHVRRDVEASTEETLFWALE